MASAPAADDAAKRQAEERHYEGVAEGARPANAARLPTRISMPRNRGE